FNNRIHRNYLYFRPFSKIGKFKIKDNFIRVYSNYSFGDAPMKIKTMPENHDQVVRLLEEHISKK
ncbi:MAG: hypothetical protein NTY61_01175, partial [Candidatus Parcubacteria bacterium]|nr:hypothetical protein [Candidatus Parcubacteria bacterium]